MVGQDVLAAENVLGPFHVHRGHDFEGFRMEERQGRVILVARCMCGEVLDVADGVLIPCPECIGGRDCVRCGGTGLVVDHAALEWRLPEAVSDTAASKTATSSQPVSDTAGREERDGDVA